MIEALLVGGNGRQTGLESQRLQVAEEAQCRRLGEYNVVGLDPIRICDPNETSQQCATL